MTKTPRGKMLARAEFYHAWLVKHHPETFDEQKHGDAGSPERAYWHHGYMSALRDALELLGPDA